MALRRLSNSSIQTNGKSSKLWDQTTFQSGMFALATVSLTSTASSIVFSNIPANYTHLQIRGLGRDTSSNNAYLLMNFNSDSGTNYTRHWLAGSGSSVVANNAINATVTGAAYALPSTAANTFGASVIDILDYQNTNKYKTVRNFTGWDANGSGYVALSSGLWMSTSVISSITLTNESTFAQYSSFALYGIKTG